MCSLSLHASLKIKQGRHALGAVKASTMSSGKRRAPSDSNEHRPAQRPRADAASAALEGAKEKDEAGASDTNSSASPSVFPLHEALERRDWDSVSALIQADTSCAKSSRPTPGEDPALPLHVALANQAPLDVIELLLKANPAAIAHTTGYGTTPLQVALREKATTAVALRVLAADPTAVDKPDYLDSMPLHTALGFGQSPDVLLKLINLHPAACAHKADGGKLPLHIAAEEGSSIEIVEALLAAHPGACTTPDEEDGGKLPVQLAVMHNSPAAVIARLRQATDTLSPKL